MIKNILLTILLILGSTSLKAQKFFNLTANDVRIDSELPCFSYSTPLGKHYSDSIYTVTIEYPEFIDMSKEDIGKLKRLTTKQFGKLPDGTNKDITTGFTTSGFSSATAGKNIKYQKGCSKD